MTVPAGCECQVIDWYERLGFLPEACPPYDWDYTCAECGEQYVCSYQRERNYGWSRDIRPCTGLASVEPQVCYRCREKQHEAS